MQITLYSILMSVIWSSILAVFNYFCRKKQFFIRQLGITNLLVLYLFSVVRMIVPYHFSFAKVIHSEGVLADLYKSAYVEKIGTTHMSWLSIFAIIWAAVSAVLITRFICQYMKAMKEVSAYEICEDEQCKRVFRQVLDKSKRQMRINIRKSVYVNIPMGVGIFKKTIILPRESYSDSELYYILRHEYTHFQNRDLMIKILMHIYRCIFWWNPAVYLLERDLAQILEIKCDLDVTDHMENRNKAEYLSTIVTMLKNAEAKRDEKVFYGTTALVSRSYESEIIERFKIVSASYGNKKSAVFTGSWFLIFGMLSFISYSFVIQPDAKALANRTVTESLSETAAGNAYSIMCVDGTYYVYFTDGR